MLILAIFLLAVKFYNFQKNDKGRVKIKIGGEFFQAEVASTQEQKARGLSGRPSLCHKCAMLFPFEENKKRSFWMKDMQFDIDIIWIKDGEIIQISPKISHIRGEAEVVNSESEINEVLEINAGESERLGLKEGDRIKID